MPRRADRTREARASEFDGLSRHGVLRDGRPPKTLQPSQMLFPTTWDGHSCPLRGCEANLDRQEESEGT